MYSLILVGKPSTTVNRAPGQIMVDNFGIKFDKRWWRLESDETHTFLEEKGCRRNLMHRFHRLESQIEEEQDIKTHIDRDSRNGEKRQQEPLELWVDANALVFGFYKGFFWGKRKNEEVRGKAHKANANSRARSSFAQ